MKGGIVGIQLNCVYKALISLLELVLIGIGESQVVVKFRILRIDSDCLFQKFFCIRKLMLIEHKHPKVISSIGPLRVCSDSFSIFNFGLIELIAVVPDFS